MKKFFFTALMCVVTLSMSAQYVDLGLPSGTKWKTVNENGNRTTYVSGHGDMIQAPKNSGALFSFDEALNKFAGKLPSQAQYEELIELCTWRWTGNGYNVIGPNKKSIYFPAFVDDEKSFEACYWTSNSDKRNAIFLIFNQYFMQIGDGEREHCYYVRLISY